MLRKGRRNLTRCPHSAVQTTRESGNAMISGPARSARSACVLCVLCGLPGSGKSTLCARLPSRTDPRFLLLSYDSLLPAVAFRPQDAVGGSTHWKYYRQSVLDCLKHWLIHGCSTQDDIPANMPAEVWTLFLKQLQQHRLLDPPWSSVKALSAKPQMPKTFPEQSPPGLAIILDDNFYYRSMRYEVYQLAREVSAGFIQIFLNCPLEQCLKRNASRIVPVPVMVLQTMAARLEVPDVERDWERESLHLDTSVAVPDVQIDTIVARIARAMGNPVPAIEDCDSLEKAQSRAECRASLVHQVDVALRRCVSDTLKQLASSGKFTPAGLRGLSQELATTKGHVLDNLRQDQLAVASAVHIQEAVDMVVQHFEAKKQRILNCCKTTSKA